VTGTGVPNTSGNNALVVNPSFDQLQTTNFVRIDTHNDAGALVLSPRVQVLITPQ
jgi:hypothetical protein